MTRTPNDYTAVGLHVRVPPQIFIRDRLFQANLGQSSHICGPPMRVLSRATPIDVAGAVQAARVPGRIRLTPLSVAASWLLLLLSF